MITRSELVREWIAATNGTLSFDGWLTAEIGRLRAELARAKAEPPRPAAIVYRDGSAGIEAEAYEDVDDAWKRYYGDTGIADGRNECLEVLEIFTWTWHPKSS